MVMYLEILEQKHLETKFIKLNVDHVPFINEHLQY